MQKKIDFFKILKCTSTLSSFFNISKIFWILENQRTHLIREKNILLNYFLQNIFFEQFINQLSPLSLSICRFMDSNFWLGMYVGSILESIQKYDI